MTYQDIGPRADGASTLWPRFEMGAGSARWLPRVRWKPLDADETPEACYQNPMHRFMLSGITEMDQATEDWVIGGVWDAQFAPLIADIHTNSGPGPAVLHVGTGAPNYMLITVKTDCATRVYVGPVLSYYEVVVPGVQRLSDEEWKEQLGSPWDTER